MIGRTRWRVGCAADNSVVTAVLVGDGAEPVRVAIDGAGTAGLDDADTSPLQTLVAGAVAAAVATVCERAGVAPGARVAIRVALLPPLAQVRRVSLPAMREEQCVRVLARDAARYFFGVRTPHIAAAQRVPAAGQEARPVIAAAVPTALSDALAAALPAGAVVDALVPAAAAWAAALRDGDHVVRTADTDIVLTIGSGVLMDVRHRPAGTASAAAASAAVAPAAAARTAGAGPAAAWTHEAAVLAAARAVWRVRGLLIRTDAQRSAARLRRKRRTRYAVLGAVALVSAAAVAAQAQLQRRLVQVRVERAALAPAVAAALATRDTLALMEARLAAAGALAAEPRLSELLAALSHRLPTDAHIVHILAVGDSVRLRVDAPTAADVLPALRSAPELRNVRIVGAIERDMTTPDAVTERFDVAAHVSTPRVATGAVRGGSQ